MHSSSSTLNKRMNIVALTWPIFIEVLLRTALNTTDVFMLSGYSDLAVSAVGVISQMSFFLIVISMMVSSGTGILIAQYNGASRSQESEHVGVASIILAVLVGGNYIALYQPFGLPVYGVAGVAISTVSSQIVATILMCLLIRSIGIKLPFREWRDIPNTVYQRIMKIGAMNAGEVLSYNMAQMTIVYFVVQMGTSSLAAYTYMQNITRLSFAFSLALGQAGQIQTSYFIGKGWIDDILIRVQKYFLIGLLVSTSAILLIFAFRYPIISLFTQDKEIMTLFAILIGGSIFIESGRVFNLTLISLFKSVFLVSGGLQ